MLQNMTTLLWLKLITTAKHVTSLHQTLSGLNILNGWYNKDLQGILNPIQIPLQGQWYARLSDKEIPDNFDVFRNNYNNFNGPARGVIILWPQSRKMKVQNSSHILHISTLCHLWLIQGVTGITSSAAEWPEMITELARLPKFSSILASRSHLDPHFFITELQSFGWNHYHNYHSQHSAQHPIFNL